MRSIVKINTKVYFIFILIFLLFFSFLFFTFPCSAQIKDAIAIRVMKNINHLSPARWYIEKVPNPGSPTSIQVDGYEAVRDGRTVYVSAANVVDTTGDGNWDTIYTNIYIMSYNKDAKESTVKIFNQLVENWRFNINIENFGICDSPDPDGNNINCSDDFDCVVNEIDYGPCYADKNKIRRDVRRLADLEDIKKDLTDYSDKTGTYPGLPKGTYVSRISTSKWPSWQETLSAELGTGASIDPINRFSGDCDLAGYDSGTCWNETAKEFKCPDGSYLYQYSSLGVCSLHCDSETPSDSEFCKSNSECPCNGPIAGTLPECQGFINQEYCIKSSAVAGISLNLESESDPMPYSFNMPSFGVDSVCHTSQIYETLALENINCCEPMSCSSLGYGCGIYKNSCRQTITCNTDPHSNADGVCDLGYQCINGACCDPNCAGKECGDDGCGSSCGACDSGYSCNSAFQCVHGCTDECGKKGDMICSGTFTADNREQINYCGYYDTDPCLEWSPTPEDCEWPNGCDGDICVCWDIDGDGFTNYICGGDDCDDTDPAVNPAAQEICDGIDNDCDTLIDSEDDSMLPVDPVASSETNQYNCVDGKFTDGGYCGDAIWQGAYGELCDGHQNCSSDCICDTGWVACDGFAADADGCECDISGSNVCWLNACCVPIDEYCNGADDDCDGLIDENDVCLFAINLDWSEGNSVNIIPSQDQLEVNPIITPYIWVASSGTNSVYRIDTATHALAGPFAVGSNPSRTAVALNGDVWVGNRDSNNVTHLDINGNFIETCPAGDGPRGLAIDADENIWVGNYEDGGSVQKLSNSSCTVLGDYTLPAPTSGLNPAGCYGAAVDGLGNVWMVNGHGTSRDLTKINISTGVIANYPMDTYLYGIAIDKNNYIWLADADAVDNKVYKINQSGTIIADINLGMRCRAIAVDKDNNIWLTHSANDKVTKLDNNGNILFSVCTDPDLDCTTTIGAQPIGVTATADGYIWVVNYTTHKACKLNPSDGSFADACVNVGLEPYTYSDMAGYMLRAVTLAKGSWIVNVDSHVTNPQWKTISWDETEPGDSYARARVRSADTEADLALATWSGYYDSSPANISAFAGRRWLQIEMVLHLSSDGESPIVDNLLIGF